MLRRQPTPVSYKIVVDGRTLYESDSARNANMLFKLIAVPGRKRVQAHCNMYAYKPGLGCYLRERMYFGAVDLDAFPKPINH